MHSLECFVVFTRQFWNMNVRAYSMYGIVINIVINSTCYKLWACHYTVHPSYTILYIHATNTFRLKYFSSNTQGPVDLKWACYIWRIFARLLFRRLFHFVSRIFCNTENHYVRTTWNFFSGLKLTNLGEVKGIEEACRPSLLCIRLAFIDALTAPWYRYTE
jgi:hypothetical protein